MPANRFYSSFDFEKLDKRPPQDGEYRNAFQIDRDRIIHSSAFRRLQSKTQVFLSGESLINPRKRPPGPEARSVVDFGGWNLGCGP
jgi:dGTP triphosphohydrolase